MDKNFTISGYLSARPAPDEQTAARLRMLCAVIDKSMRADNRERSLRTFVADGAFMRFAAGCMHELPEAITCGQRDFEPWLELFMTSDEPEAVRYVMRLSSWYTHFCCVEELLTMCRLVRRIRRPHSDDLNNRLLHYFRTARKVCGMPDPDGPGKGLEIGIRLLDACYDRITREIVLLAEEALGMHGDHTFIETVMICHVRAKTAEELAVLCGAGSLVTFRRTFLRLFGCPVSQWLRERRTERIWELLRSRNLSLQEVAEECGFANQSYLTDFCKRNLGDTPANIRRSDSRQAGWPDKTE